jgi:hypothetical protein
MNNAATPLHAASAVQADVAIRRMPRSLRPPDVICLGARAVLVGRSYAYGLAAAGQAGVARALEILRADVEPTLCLLGCPSIATLDASCVETPAAWHRTSGAR